MVLRAREGVSNGRASRQPSKAVCKQGCERVVQEMRDLLQDEWIERGNDSTQVADAPRGRGPRCLVGVK